MDLQTAWYFVLASALLMYVLLDGFDLGVGAFHLFAKTDEERRLMLNSIGPVWDGNEVWIVVVVGGLFAGFPAVYATVFSGFYTWMMLLLLGLIFRAVAIEFRSKHESKIWRSLWDYIFSFASILVAFLLGLILGNLIVGIPLDANQNFVGTTLTFLNPYSILLGITAISLFAMHGTIYLAMKTEGAAHEIIRKWILPAIAVFIFFYLVTSIATLYTKPSMLAFLEHNWLFSAFPILAFIAIFNVPYQVKQGRDGWAFICSCLSIALLISLYALGTFPVIVASTIDPINNSLTIYNTASTSTTLTNLLIIVAIGLPLVFAYSYWVYRTFRGKVRLDKHSY
jgi:cytochrome d ubiquinol oxidase subunit II